MTPLLDFFRKTYYLVLFLLLEVVSFVLLFRFNHYQGSVWYSSANAVVASVNSMYDEVLAYINLGEVNRELTDENLRQQSEMEALRDVLHSVVKDSTATEKRLFRTLADYKTFPAKVISNHHAGGSNFLVINLGEADGIRPEMGVVSGSGVVGIVYLTETHHSLVLPIINRMSSISCRLRGQNYFGYLRWEGGSRRTAFLDEIPRYARVKVGDIVETSGYSAVFPPGLFVGRVGNIENSADGQAYTLDVRLGANFSNIREVSVVQTDYKAEVDSLFKEVGALSARPSSASSSF